MYVGMYACSQKQTAVKKLQKFVSFRMAYLCEEVYHFGIHIDLIYFDQYTMIAGV